MSWFAQAFVLILLIEGGLSDDPEDAGGRTNLGISTLFAEAIGLDVDGDGRTTDADIDALTRPMAKELYRVHVWQKCRCDELPPPLALAVYDTGVNHGVPRALRLLQAALHVKVDGLIGPITLGAAREADPRVVLRHLLAERAVRYGRSPKFKRFGRGWSRRLFRVHQHALAWLARIEHADDPAPA